MTPSQNHPSGVLRREFLQVGFSAYLGLGISGVLAGRARAGDSGAGAAALGQSAHARPRAGR